MEGFLIFLAIIAIQMIAAYTKQKKEAAKRQQQPQPVEFEMPVWEDEEEIEEIEEEFVEDEKPVLRQEPLPVIEPVEIPIFVPPKAHPKLKINITNVELGIIWAAVLQEPRYKVKWKPVCSR